MGGALRWGSTRSRDASLCSRVGKFIISERRATLKIVCGQICAFFDNFKVCATPWGIHSETQPLNLCVVIILYNFFV